MGTISVPMQLTSWACSMDSHGQQIGIACDAEGPCSEASEDAKS